MKSTILSIATLLAGVMAQDLTSLPECSQNCINSLISEGPNYGCPADSDNNQPSVVCLCSKTEFANGINDCSSQSCPSGTDLESTNEYGVSYCSSAEPSASGTSLSAIAVFSSLASATVADSSSATTTGGTGTGTGTADSTTTTTSSSNSSSSSTTMEGSTSTTEVPILSTVTSGSSTFETTVGSTSSETVIGASSSSAGAVAARGRPGGVASGFGGFATGPVVALTVALGGLVGGVVGLAGLMNA